ncbi:MAG: uracil-DNA glycosylase [Candidatus Binatia bacterium]
MGPSVAADGSNRWRRHDRAVTQCRLCPRLVAYREQVAREKRRQYRDDTYWGRPIPGFGDRGARLLIVGLAPAAHGANRTGRMFTGDRSGEWLYAALHATGFASQATAVRPDDGLALIDAYVTAIARCAPPANKPTPAEIANCRPYLVRELELLDRVRVVVCLGGLALDGFLRAWRESGRLPPAKRPRFAHGAEYPIAGGIALLCSYHPSQQNTFTGRLTRAMLDAVFARAREVLGTA